MVSVMSESAGFVLDKDPMRLPEGAWAKTERRILRHGARAIAGLSQGPFRPYLCPVYTPKGFAVTCESPADHPHHNSIWIGSDQVRCRVPAAGGRVEDHTYNFYVNETFHGRAAGTILATTTAGKALSPGRYAVRQSLEWRGPREWGAPEGRVVARERRFLDVTPGSVHNILDVRSELCAGEWDLVLGPTRHAFFNVRVADAMQLANGGRLMDAEGHSDAQAIGEGAARWVDFSGPVGGGHTAGITVMPHPDDGPPGWFVADWGVMTVGHFRDREIAIAPGQSMTFRFRVIVRDGGAPDSGIAALYSAYVNGDRP